MNKKFLGGLVAILAVSSFSFEANAAGYSQVGEYGRPFVYVTEDSGDDIQEEIYMDELELLAQLVEAEAGNQPFEGKCLVVDVVLNRVESDLYPDTITEVIFQKDPVQFTTTVNGALEKAGYSMKEDDYKAVMYEIELHTNKNVMNFNNCSSVSGKGKKFKVGDHWFRNG